MAQIYLPKNMTIKVNRKAIEFNRKEIKFNRKAIKFNQTQSKGNQTQSNSIEFNKVFPFSIGSIGIQLIRSIKFQSFDCVRLLSIDSIIEFFD